MTVQLLALRTGNGLRMPDNMYFAIGHWSLVIGHWSLVLSS
jgi:hypothetical protein